MLARDEGGCHPVVQQGHNANYAYGVSLLHTVLVVYGQSALTSRRLAEAHTTRVALATSQ
eukprot:2601253-Pleurochrysis_carterae.AAC.2